VNLWVADKFNQRHAILFYEQQSSLQPLWPCILSINPNLFKVTIIFRITLWICILSLNFLLRMTLLIFMLSLDFIKNADDFFIPWLNFFVQLLFVIFVNKVILNFLRRLHCFILLTWWSRSMWVQIYIINFFHFFMFRPLFFLLVTFFLFRLQI